MGCFTSPIRHKGAQPFMIKFDQIIVITGKRGSGKTTFAKKLIASIPENRIKIIDINGEYKNSFIPNNYSEIDVFLKNIWEKGNIFLVIDEADTVFPEHKKLQDYYYKIIHLGRHRNIGLLAITRRIARLNKDVIANAHHIFVFSLVIPNDVKYLREFMGGEIEQAYHLNTGEKIYFDGKKIKKLSSNFKVI
jgi:DNA helicase HerA-like ATPase